MGKKKKDKIHKVLELKNRTLTASFSKSFEDYGNEKIYLSQSGTIPEDSSETDVNHTYDEMFRQVRDKIEELGEQLEEDKKNGYYDD